MPKTVFLETHNLKNKATGLGTFNYELIKGLSQVEFEGLELTLNLADPASSVITNTHRFRGKIFSGSGGRMTFGIRSIKIRRLSRIARGNTC